MKQGIDLSHHNQVTDWDRIKQDFIIHKCTQGTNFLDPAYKERKDKITGTYHFAGDFNKVAQDPIKEADWYLKNTDTSKDLVLDWEINHSDPVGWCKAFADQIRKKTGKDCWLYTNDARAVKFAWEGFKTFWIARYGTNDGTPQREPNFSNWTIWQYTSNGFCSGIAGRVDFNLMKETPCDHKKELVWPIDKVFITQKFGENPQIYQRFGMKGHNGVDFRTRFWDSLLGKRYTLASKAGKVVEAYLDAGYGWMVRLEHDLDPNGNEQTVYGHHKKLYVKVGDQIKQGQTIALTDNTGFSTGPHLHFGWRKKGWKKEYQNGYKGYSDPFYELTKT